MSYDYNFLIFLSAGNHSGKSHIKRQPHIYWLGLVRQYERQWHTQQVLRYVNPSFFLSKLCMYVWSLSNGHATCRSCTGLWALEPFRLEIHMYHGQSSPAVRNIGQILSSHMQVYNWAVCNMHHWSSDQITLWGGGQCIFVRLHFCLHNLTKPSCFCLIFIVSQRN